MGSNANMVSDASKPPLQTAVLFLVFNRPEQTAVVFKAIRDARPPRLYVAADGARVGQANEDQRVALVRRIATAVDWPCEVRTLFQSKNLGCKQAVSQAITWFFSHEEMGIILEDDCLPSKSFFWFCEDLLNRYAHNESIYLVSGDGRGSESFPMPEDYGLCKYPLIWGWASWRRVWDQYDLGISSWPSVRATLPEQISDRDATRKFWRDTFDKVHSGVIDTCWDYQLSFLLLTRRGKCIVPRVNLITNIGFGHDATHTTTVDPSSANRKRHEIELPLRHLCSEHSEARINAYFDKHIFSNKSLIYYGLKKLKRLLHHVRPPRSIEHT